MRQGEYWGRRLSATQRHYLRACDTLARVRRLLIPAALVQVDVAAEGGKQVNVVGTESIHAATLED